MTPLHIFPHRAGLNREARCITASKFGTVLVFRHRVRLLARQEGQTNVVKVEIELSFVEQVTGRVLRYCSVDVFKGTGTHA
jgi:hypothetical protein